MPIVNRRGEPVTQLAGGALPDAPAVESPGILDTIGAAFRQNNLVVSGLNEEGSFRGINNDVQPGYSAFNDIKGTPYEDHWEDFARSNNQRYTEALKHQIDGEQKDRRTLQASGWTGTIANFGANVLDPTILLPVGGEIIKGAQGGYKILDVGLRSAAAGGLSTTVQEAGLHASQYERTNEESAYAIGGGVILGGLLGAGVSALLSKGERATALRGYDALLPVEGGGGLSAAPTSQSLGLDALTVDGTMAHAIADKTKALSPNLRLNFSPNKVSRQVGQELSEGTLYQVGNAEGLTTGPSVSRLAGMTERARLADGMSSLNAIYSDMKKSGINMPFADFDEAVGKAMRAEDVGENDFISQAAKAMRAKIVEPFFNDGKAVGLYEDGDAVSFAPSYFPRQYRTKVLVANENLIKPEWVAHMEGHIAANYAESAQTLRTKHGELDQQISDLNLSPDERAKVMAELEQQGEALDAANTAHIDRAAQINQLRRTKPEGYQKEVERIRAEGGEGLATYVKQRGAIRSRLERVDFGHAGLEDRQTRIAGSIAKLEDANQRGLRRLVARGQALQRTTDKLNPKKLAAEMSGLKTAFADVLARSEKAMDRTAKAAEKLGQDAPAGMADRLVAEHAAQAARHERLTSLAERIEKAENLDPEAKLAAAHDAIDEVVAEVADVTVRRGEKAARLVERQKALDPARITAQVAKIAAKKAASLRAFYDHWEIRNLGENIDPFDPAILPNFKQIAKATIDEVYDKLTGRDYGSSASVAPEYLTPITRGPVRERTLPIPDSMLTRQGVLNNRATEVLHRYSRTLAADVELTRKFGDARLDEPLKKIADEYAKLREQVATPVTPADIKMAETQPEKWAKELQARYAALDKQQRADQRDIEALRDLIRGTYKAAENGATFGRVVRAAGHMNFVRSLGGVVISSLSDIYRPAMVHGLFRFMGEGVGPLLTNLDAVKLAVHEAQLGGTVTDQVLAHRMTSYSGIADPLERGTPIERTLDNMSKLGSKWSGLNIWTDGVKSISSILSQNRILNGKADMRTLAFLGIDPGTAKTIRAEFAAHGEVMSGVHVANTEKWADQDAVRAFRAAVGKDVDSIIVTPGVGDAPLFSKTPLGRVLLQFQNFMLASHQRVLLRGLQENKAQFISGMVGMTTLGMLQSTLRSWRGGRDRYEKFKKDAENPGFLISDGLDSSGVFTLGFQLSNTMEQLTRSAGFSFNPIKTPAMALGALARPGSGRHGQSTRFAQRSPLSALGGPTAGMVEDVANAAAGGVNLIRHKKVAQSQKNAAVRLIPYNSFLGFREAIQAMNGDSPYIDPHAVHSEPVNQAEPAAD